MEIKSRCRLARISALAEKLRFLPHLSEAERLLYAWSLDATPDERWRRHEDFLRSVRSSRLFMRKGEIPMLLPLPSELAVNLKRLRTRR